MADPLTPVRSSVDTLGAWSHAIQFDYMVRHGMTPLAAIIRQRWTRHACSAGKTGWARWEPGRWADIVAVDRDPTVDVELLSRPAVVIRGGEVIFRAAPRR